jgi:hypothetical protein
MHAASMHAHPLFWLLSLILICQVAAYPELFAAWTSSDCNAIPKRAYGSHRQPQPDRQATQLHTDLILHFNVELSDTTVLGAVGAQPRLHCNTSCFSAAAAAAAATAGRGAKFEITRGGKPRMRIVAGTKYNITVSKQRHTLLTSWQHSAALCCSCCS